MARAGTTVDEAIECAGLGAEVVADRLLQISAPHYRAVRVGAHRFQLARSYRPTWALAVGAVLTPVLVGLPFFLVRRPEAWTATIEEDHRRVRVRVRGEVLPQVLVALREALGDPTAGARPATPPRGLPAARPVPTPPPPAPPAPATPPPAPAPAATPPPPPAPPPPGGPLPPPPPPPGPSAPAPPPPVATPAPAPSRIVLCFDTGEQRPLEGLVLVGRDPQPGPDEGHADLVAVIDPDMSVSKTHLAAWVEDGAIWVADRGSTNGTVVEDEHGAARPVPASSGLRARTGSTVRFGTRSFVVTEEQA